MAVISEKYCLITGTRRQTQLWFLCKTQPFLHAFQVRTKELMLSPYCWTFVTTEMFFSITVNNYVQSVEYEYLQEKLIQVCLDQMCVVILEEENLIHSDTKQGRQKYIYQTSSLKVQ